MKEKKVLAETKDWSLERQGEEIVFRYVSGFDTVVDGVFSLEDFKGAVSRLQENGPSLQIHGKSGEILKLRLIEEGKVFVDFITVRGTLLITLPLEILQIKE